MQRKSLKTFLNLFCEQMSSDCQEMKDMAARICRDYLHGPWKKVNTQTIGFKHIRCVIYFSIFRNFSPIFNFGNSSKIKEELSNCFASNNNSAY